MQKLIFIFTFLIPLGTWGQIDQTFIAQHTYTDLKEALQNPDEVYALDLSEKGLTEFPSEIFQFKNLRRLNLANLHAAKNPNMIEELPRAIGQLKQLEYLAITRNSIKKLPREIADLQNLKGLYCSGNHLKKLPKEIGQLENLQELFCADNQLKKLPPEIGQLANLKILSCGYNQLKKLPPEIGELQNLQRLSCGRNLFEAFPKEISKLQNLAILTSENSALSKEEMDTIYEFLPNCEIQF